MTGWRRVGGTGAPTRVARAPHACGFRAQPPEPAIRAQPRRIKRVIVDPSRRFDTAITREIGPARPCRRAGGKGGPQGIVTKFGSHLNDESNANLAAKTSGGKRHSCFHASPRKDNAPQKYFCNLQDTSVILSAHLPWHTVSAWGFNPFRPVVNSCQIIILVLKLCEACRRVWHCRLLRSCCA
jgi:hypothetical protein